jgi:hypothetical protein
VTREGGNTVCPNCARTIIRRSWHKVEACEVDHGRCLHCNAEIPGRFD